MIYGLWLSAAGLQTSQYRQAVIANNLANADTVGFKESLAVIRERLVESRSGGKLSSAHPVLDDMTGGSFVAPTYTRFSQGQIEPSSNPLDVAIIGEGFFQIKQGEQIRYTRDGRFTVNAEGRLVTVAGGFDVLDVERRPIVLGQRNAGPARIAEDGTVYRGDTVAGQLGVVDFADKSLLRHVGKSGFEPVGIEPLPATARVRSGALERSTVDPIRTMASMIEAARAYQMNAMMISLQDGMLGRAVNDVGQVSQ